MKLSYIDSLRRHQSISLGRFYWLLILCVLGVGCTKDTGDLKKNIAFEEVIENAKRNDVPFCIVLTDSTQQPSQEYLQFLLSDYKYITKKAIFNIIDIDSEESDLYVKWLTPFSFPLTCVFSPNGQLIDLIPGAVRESFLYIDQAIVNQKITDYHWPNRIQKNKRTIIPLLAQLINFENEINNGRYRWRHYTSLSDSLQHPYMDYLLLKAVALSGDSVFAVYNAQKLLAHESPSTLEFYKEEFIEAKKILNSKFDISNAPNIRVAKKSIILSDLKIGDSVPIDIVLYNEGEEPLKIEKINLSCTCLSLEGPDKGIIIEGRKSYTAKFHLRPENSGVLSRDIFISSNALNQPSLHINIVANVISEI